MWDLINQHVWTTIPLTMTITVLHHNLKAILNYALNNSKVEKKGNQITHVKRATMLNNRRYMELDGDNQGSRWKNFPSHVDASEVIN